MFLDIEVKAIGIKSEKYKRSSDLDPVIKEYSEEELDKERENY